MIKKASKFQKSVVEQVEKIGDAITLIEEICKVIEELDPILIYGMEEETHYTLPITEFIINHRKYTIWYNEMRDVLFNDLTSGAYIIKNEF